MPQGIFNKILNQLDTLELLELQQLERAIGRYLAQKEQTAQRTKFHQALLTSGLVKKNQAFFLESANRTATNSGRGEACF